MSVDLQKVPGREKHPRDVLIDSTIRLIYEGGQEEATTRAIAKSAGVTEGAIYRHYQSKEELRRHAYQRVVEDMIRGKEHLVFSADPIRHKLRKWIRITYTYFDRHPEAFTYALLLPPAFRR